ncbi:MAG: hypothetical protein R3B47_05380 [Bacteroidia bacterium]
MPQKGSKHLDGQAIDVVVLDVNEDGKADAEDVDIVYELLDKKIIRDKGGIGTYYKNSKDFFSRQMVHFDCRGRRRDGGASRFDMPDGNGIGGFEFD